MSEKNLDPCSIVIFGATGDLTKRKLMPSIYKLFKDGLMPKKFAVIGASKSPLTTDEFRKMIAETLSASDEFEKNEEKSLHDFLELLTYSSGSFEDDKVFLRLEQEIKKAEAAQSLPENRIYYLAVPPHFFSPIIINLRKNAMAEETDTQWRRLVIEKPLGHDLDSSRKLAQELNETFKETQLYRIDHYLGKESVQNIIVLRFANGIFEPIWNRQYIDSIQITVAEELGVERRGSYYDDIGALKDMVPSHLFQILALMAMESPASLEADDIRDEYKKVLSSVVHLSQEDVQNYVVRGQYGKGEIQGKSVPGYREEPDLSKSSTTDTFVALRLMIDTWRWADVPFYLRTGKRLKKKGTEVVIQFKAAPGKLFCKTQCDIGRNQLVIHIQPGEQISLQFGVKIPGPLVEVQNVDMTFKYQDYFEKEVSTGYETLIFDCMKGDATFFRRADQVDLAWKLLEPILEAWKNNVPNNFPNYSAGSSGPKEADDLLIRDGRKWRDVT